MEEKENVPTITFDDFKLNRQLLNAVTEAGYNTPTPVQQQTIPLITAGHDVMGIAKPVQVKRRLTYSRFS